MRSSRPTAARSTRTIATAGDRVREFRLARRHTIFVRFFRVVLPLIATASLISYGAVLVAQSGIRTKGLQSGPVSVDTKNLTMAAPKYIGFGKDGERYEIRAREAITDLRQTGPVRLNDIEGDIVQKTGVTTKLKAVWGTFDQKQDLLELYDKIDIDGSTGMKARLTRATVYTKESRVLSSEPVYAETEAGTIRSQSMVMNHKARQATFVDRVHVLLKSNQAAGAGTGTPAPAVAMTGLSANSGQPIDVKSEQLDIDDTAKTALFRRNVIAQQGEATLQAPELDVLYEGKADLAAPAPEPKQTGVEPQTKLKTIKARGRVFMTNKDDKAESETLDYDAATERALLRGDVILTSVNDRRVTSASAELDQKANTALLTGDVVIHQARNIMRSGRVFIDRKSGKTRLDSPAPAGLPAGRITTMFYQSEAKSQASVPLVKEPNAASSLSPFGTFKTDPNAPIEVTSDTLDIADHTKTALYRGAVVAKQGEFVVQTSEMTAFYSGQTGIGTAAPGGAKKAASPKEGAEKDSNAQLTRVEARHKVVVTSKDGQTATGDWADFDVKANKVVIGGKVVVKQGKNVVEGTRLLIDMTTGQTNFEQGVVAAGKSTDQSKSAAAAPNEPAVSTGSGKGPALSSAASGASPLCPPGVVCSNGILQSRQRVRAVLYPKEVETKARKAVEDVVGTPAGGAVKPKKPDTAGSNGSAWSSTVDVNAGTKQ